MLKLAGSLAVKTFMFGENARSVEAVLRQVIEPALIEDQAERRLEVPVRLISSDIIVLATQ